MTLRETWERKRMKPTEVAGLAGITTATLYKMNRKESVKQRNLKKVLEILEISEDEYNSLEAEALK